MSNNKNGLEDFASNIPAIPLKPKSLEIPLNRSYPKGINPDSVSLDDVEEVVPYEEPESIPPNQPVPHNNPSAPFIIFIIMSALLFLTMIFPTGGDFGTQVLVSIFALMVVTLGIPLFIGSLLNSFWKKIEAKHNPEDGEEPKAVLIVRWLARGLVIIMILVFVIEKFGNL